MHNINFGVAGRIICSDVFGHDQKERRVTTMSNPEIVIKTLGGPLAEVYVNGRKLDGVKGYNLTHRAGEIPHLTLELSATNVTVETKVLPELPEPYKNSYVSISSLLNLNLVSKIDLNELLREQGLEII